MDCIYLSFSVISNELRYTLKMLALSQVQRCRRNHLLHSLYFLHPSTSVLPLVARRVLEPMLVSCTVRRQPLYNMGAICIFIICVMNDCMNPVISLHVLILR